MGSPRLEMAMDVPGRMAYGCSDLSAAWPHGGTGLGFVSTVWLDWDVPVYQVTAEEYGAEVVDEVALGERLLIRAVLRDTDPDALGQAAPNSTTGAPSGFKVLQGPSTNRAGYFYSTRGTVVVFTPQSVIDGNDDQHDVVVFLNALPRLQEASRIAFHARNERQYPLAFRAIRDGSGDTYKIGRRSDITL